MKQRPNKPKVKKNIVLVLVVILLAVIGLATIGLLVWDYFFPTTISQPATQVELPVDEQQALAPAPVAPAPAPVAPGVGAPPGPAFAGDWRIGIITGSGSWSEEYQAALMMQERFGADRIVRSTYPANFGAETISNVLSLINQGARAIVFVQAVPGAIAAIQTARNLSGDDIFFFWGAPQEPPAEVAQHADIVMSSDYFSMGRAIIEQAHRMGATSFAHISFPRHLGMESVSYRRAGLMQTAAQFGMEWIELTAPDPMTEGVAIAQFFILENMPQWIAQFGQNTAFFHTSCDMPEPMITQIAFWGGLFPMQCHPGPLHALPAAFNISMQGREGDLNFAVSQLRSAIAAAGGSGRFSTWAMPVNTLLVEVGVMYSIEYLEGRVGRHDRAALSRIVQEVSTGMGGGGITLSNWPLGGGVSIDNFYLVLSDFIDF
ncbi:MAG: DUF3798 domain-containing protein [Spirochaetes bacterium]|nr:DUF3798 domain-containing protein [Spirochaetota bacterium]